MKIAHTAFSVSVACLLGLSVTIGDALAAPTKDEGADYGAEEDAVDPILGPDGEPLTCMEEPVGDWMTAYDGFQFRVWNQAAEVSWNIRTHLDPEVTSGLLVEVTRPRRTSGYVQPPEVQLWYNPPKITLQNSVGKSYYAFGPGLSHTFERSAGFGMKQVWIESDQFWFPEKDVFTVKSRQTQARKAMQFERELAKTDQKLRVELYVPMYSDSEPVAYGELLDTKGLSAAMKIAAQRNHDLFGMHAECRMPNLVLEEPVAKDEKGGKH